MKPKPVCIMPIKGEWQTEISFALYPHTQSHTATERQKTDP